MDGQDSFQERTGLRMRAPARILPCHKQRGTSLHEALVVVSIASVLYAGGAAMHPVMLDAAIKTHIGQMFADLQFARSEAIMRRVSVTICKSANGMACDKDNRWQQGWIIFVDTDGDNKKDSDEIILRRQEALPHRMTLKYGEIANYTYATYYPQGYARPNATFTFCDHRGSSKARAIVISSSGRPRVTTRITDNKSLTCAP